jgi:large subunit ribosomal protein L9
MKVLLRRNVIKLGKIGEVVDVKPGYARNYLLPQRLGVQPTAGNVKAVEAEKAAYLQELAKLKKELEARAALVNGTEVTISARANDEGSLYGSVGPAQIAAALAEQKIFVEARDVELPQAIRKLDKYDVTLRFNEEVTAIIKVWVVRLREPGEILDEEEPAKKAKGDEGDEEAPEADAQEATYEKASDSDATPTE